MAKIRKDLAGVVIVDGRVLKAGDEIPDGVAIGGHLTADGKPVGVVEKPVEAKPDEPESGVEPLTEDEIAEAKNIGLDPVDEIHPERVRGALFGYAQGFEDCQAEIARASGQPPQPFDPSEHNAPAVLAYLEANPDEVASVLEAEKAGKARSGILSKFE